MFLSVIIPTYNRVKYLKEALASLEKQDFPKADFEVVVVDDGSIDGTEKVVSGFSHPAVIPAKAGIQDNKEYSILDNLDPRFRGDDKIKSGNDKEEEGGDDKRGLNLKYLKENHRGASHARNIGIKNAKGEVMVFFDDDATARGDWLKNIAVIMAGEQIITGRVEPAHQNIWRHFAPHYNQGEEATESEIILEGNCAIRREVFDNIGFFDENLDYGHEGKEFLARAQESYVIRYYPQVVIYHDYAFGFFNYLHKQWRFGEKMVYLALKGGRIRSLNELIYKFREIKNFEQSASKHKNIKTLKQNNLILVKIIAKCGSGAHFLGAISGYFKYKKSPPKD